MKPSAGTSRGGLGATFELKTPTATQNTNRFERVLPDLPDTRGCTLDETLTHIGEFGRGQWWIFFLVSLAWMPGAVQTLVMVFIHRDPISAGFWRCTGEGELADRCAEIEAARSSSDFCSELVDHPDAWEWTHKSYSILSDFNIPCQAYKAAWTDSLFFLGFLLGAGWFGSMSDARGRKRALFTCTALSVASAALGSMARGYWPYTLLRATTGVGCGGMGLVAYVLACEPIGTTWRGAAGASTQYFFSLGCMLLSLLAYLVRPWRALTLISALSSAAFLLIWPYFPESPRWLLVQGRKGEATAVLAAIASRNGTALPDQPLMDTPPPAIGATSSHPALLVLRHAKLRKPFLVMVFAWVMVSLVYYGINFALGDLPGSIYLNFFMTSLIELPANFSASLLVDCTGRRTTFSGNYLLAGITCCMCVFANGGVQTGLAVIGKFGVCAAFNIAFLYTAELFPTIVRNGVLGTTSQAARVGSMAAPLVVSLSNMLGSPRLSFLVFGLSGIAGGTMALSLPETLGAPMPDTLTEGEE